MATRFEFRTPARGDTSPREIGSASRKKGAVLVAFFPALLAAFFAVFLHNAAHFVDGDIDVIDRALAVAFTILSDHPDVIHRRV